MRLSDLVLGAVLIAAAVLPAADVESAGSGAAYSVRYFESAAASADAAARLVREFSAASHRAPGNLGFTALQEIGRPSRFAVFETWQDRAAGDAHETAAATIAFRDQLAPMLVGPFEVRSFAGFSLAPPGVAGGASAVHVLTHVDVFPKAKDRAAGLLAGLAAAGRKMSGNLSFDVLQMDGHPNHFTLVEVWRDRDAFDASLTTAATRDFRQQLAPLEGALYDERLYRELH